jgi:hypothetical protein
MSLQIRRGTAAQLANITPVSGELIYTTDTSQVYVGDGTTVGGIPVAVGAGGNLSGVNVIATANVSAGGSVLTGNISVSGNSTSNNVIAGNIVSAGGNVRGGNINTGGVVSAAGNIYATAFIGNGYFLTGVISNYNNTNVSTYLGSGNSLSISITGNISSAGNITSGGYFLGNGGLLTGIVSYSNVAVATYLGSGNAMVISTTGNINTTANVRGGNLTTGGLITASGNIYTQGKVYAIGNLESGGNVSAGFFTGNALSVISNVSAANINATNNLSVLGNVFATYYFGAYSNATIVTAVTGNFNNISATANIQTAELDVSTINAGTISTTGDVLIGGNISITGSTTVDELLSGNISASGNILANINIIGGNILTDGIVSATGNLLTSGLISALGNIYGNLHLGNIFSASGNVRGGNLTTAGILTVNSGNAVTAIVNGGGSAVGNIGSTAKPFNTVFAVASTALYADLAERYLGDDEYEPGTVVSFGGNQEVTMTVVDSDPRVAGVVSTNPAYDMNSGLAGEYVTAVALMGRVPCQVEGTVTKGALMVAAGNGRARAELAPAMGTVIGKALENFAGDIGTIEIVVGRV